MTVEELQVIITAQTSGLQSQVNQVKKSLAGLERSAKQTSNSIGTSFTKISKAFKLIAGAAVVKAMVNVGKQAVNLASDLQEVQNVVDVSFGAAAEEINEFAKTAITQLGMSEYTAKKMASTFMSMSNGMNVAADAGKTMAVELTKLAGDMASFYNVEQDIAETALKSVYTGETESLKKFGVVMTQANLEAYALSQGITKSYNAMSQAEKVMLRYKYVMQATANAQGDFARTSNSWANQTRILKEQWSQLLGIMGKGLIQVLTPMVQALNKLLGYLISIGNAIAKAFGWDAVKSTTATVTDTAGAAGGLSDNMEETANNTDKANESAKKLQKTLGNFDELNVMADNSDSGSSDDAGGDAGGLADFGDLSGSVEATTDTASEKVSGFLDKIKEALAGLVEYLKPIWEAFKNAFKFDELKDQFLDICDRWKERLQKFWEGLDFSKYQAAFIDLADSVGNYFYTVLSSIMTLADTIGGDLFDDFAPYFTEVINNLIPTLIHMLASLYDVVSVVIEEMTSCILTAWDDINPIFELLGKILTDVAKDISAFWDEHGQPMVEKTIEGVRTLGETLRNFWETLIAPILDKLVSKLTEIWDEHLHPTVQKILDIIGDLWEMLMDFWNNVLAPIVNFIINEVGPPIVEIVNAILEVVGNVIADIIDFINGLLDVLDGVIVFLSGVFTGDWTKAWEGIKQIFEGIWEMIKSIIKAAVDIICGILELAWELIKNTIIAVWNVITGIFKAIWDGLCKIVQDAADWLENNLSTLWQNIKNTIVSVWNAIKSFFEEIWTKIKNTIISIVTDIKNSLETAWNTIKNILTTLMEAIKKMFDTMLEAIKKLWSLMSSKVQEIVSNLHDKLSGLVTKIGNMITTKFTNVKDKVAEVFTGLKDKVVDVFNALGTALKTPINAIISAINSMISKVVDGFNGMIDVLNGLHFDVPSWVPGIGGKSFGFSINHLSAPQIPALANGGVITSPTVALMGEYTGARSNPEIVAPQSILRETMAESNNELIDVLIDLNRQVLMAIGSIDMEVSIGDDVIGKSVQRANNTYKARTGLALI